MLRRSTIWLWLGIILGVPGLGISAAFLYGIGILGGEMGVAILIFIVFGSVSLFVLFFGLYSYYQLRKLEEQADEVEQLMEQRKKEIEQKKKDENYFCYVEQ